MIFQYTIKSFVRILLLFSTSIFIATEKNPLNINVSFMICEIKYIQKLIVVRAKPYFSDRIHLSDKQVCRFNENDSSSEPACQNNLCSRWTATKKDINHLDINPWHTDPLDVYPFLCFRHYIIYVVMSGRLAMWSAEV